MIRALGRKEFAQRRALFAIAFVLVLALTASMPFVYVYSLHQASLARANETAQIVLRNFRTFAIFIEAQWLSRSLARLLMLLALLAGSGAIAGEREARTLPLLRASAVPVRTIVVMKFVMVAAWLFLIVLASTAVLVAHSLVEAKPLPVDGIAIASLVAFANGVAFLGIVFAASAFASRTVIAGAIALVVGFSLGFALRAAGVDGTAFGTNLFAADGSVIWAKATADLAIAGAIALGGLTVAFAGVEVSSGGAFASLRRALEGVASPWEAAKLLRP